MTTSNPGETLQHVSLTDQLIFDSNSNLIGIRNQRSAGNDLRPTSGNVVPLTGAYTLTAADNGVQYACTAALTVTVPVGLSPRPSVIFDCPPTGNLTFVSSGGTLLNGATTTLTRSRASNATGIALVGHQDADSYGVSGV